MQEFKITIELEPNHLEEVIVPEGTTIEQLAKEYETDTPIILAKCDNKLRELSKEINHDCMLRFLGTDNHDGKRAYRRSVVLLLQAAINQLYGQSTAVKVLHSLGEGYYCEISKDLKEKDLSTIKAKMKELVELDLPIEKKSMKTDMAEAMFKKIGMTDKERLLHYRRSSRTNVYTLGDTVDYFYGYMVPSTGYLKTFDLVPFENSFVLLFDEKPLQTSNKLFETLQSSREWSKMLGFGTIGTFNDAISHGKAEQMVLLSEALMEERIGALAQQIKDAGNKKFVMIAGPSSSGKTSFSNRLSIQLLAKGLTPHPIGLDDYYIDREFCPRDADGNYDLECLGAIDVEKFNEDMTKLLAGEEIMMPSFNFKTGKREYRGGKLKLGKDDILVIEGIHGLNPQLSYTLPDESKFRIYISALTQLNIDEHNPLPTTDGRLLRRIVRDARTRGTTARETIAMWPSVRRGEEKYIFPFQDGADVMFNSALIYELAVLKVYAEPLLFQIQPEDDEYLEAKRLLKLLDYVLPMPTESIMHSSLMREFIGGSCFNV